jgi:hypothetical protein
MGYKYPSPLQSKFATTIRKKKEGVFEFVLAKSREKHQIFQEPNQD